MKTILKEFNEKWKGKVVNYCELIGNTLNFNPEGATFCCSSTTGNSPIVYETEELIEKGLSKELYVKAMIREFENNQSGCGKCVGCEKLKKYNSKRLMKKP